MADVFEGNKLVNEKIFIGSMMYTLTKVSIKYVIKCRGTPIIISSLTSDYGRDQEISIQ